MVQDELRSVCSDAAGGPHAEFRSARYQDISLSDWLTHPPPAMVAAHFNLSSEDIAKFPNDSPKILPL